jgi:hypothetical protein
MAEKSKTVLAYMLHNAPVNGRLLLAETVVEIPRDVAEEFAGRGVVRKTTVEERAAFKRAVQVSHFGEDDDPDAALAAAKDAPKGERQSSAKTAAEAGVAQGR